MPLVYQIHTRAWLRELSDHAGKPLTIGGVPDSEIEHWDNLGFSDIWLMGVWKIGAGAREKALEHWRTEWRQEIPSQESDVTGSPYAIEDYVIDPAIGTVEEFLAFKRKVNEKGMGLILDFVPNHFALDTPAAAQFPSYFVQGRPGTPGTFTRKTKFGKKTFAHGRDPHFPPWTDTIQVEHRNRAAQEAMQGLARARIGLCDGFRCDMAMLVTPEVFAKTWQEFPPAVQEPPHRHFWRDLWRSVEIQNPYFVAIAEVYWDREAELQEHGFDFTYHKPFYDLLMRGETAELVELLQKREPGFLARCLHFLENHDEPRIASLLPWHTHKLAAFLLLTLPGMALLHDGQLEGRKAFARIQMSKRPPEEPNEEIRSFYEALLLARKGSLIHEAAGSIIRPIGANETGADTEHLLVTLWEGKDGPRDLAIVNLGKKLARGSLRIPLAEATQPQLLFSTDPAAPCALQIIDQMVAVEIGPESGQLVRLAAP